MCGLPLPPGTYNQMAGVNRAGVEEDSSDFAVLDQQQRMDKAWRAYKGQFDKPFRRLDPGAPDFNVIVNRCEPIVSAAVEFLYGDDVTFEVAGDEAGGASSAGDGGQEGGSNSSAGGSSRGSRSNNDAAQAYLDATLAAQPQGKMPTLYEFEINQAVFGHAFIKLEPDDADTAPYPALEVLNPQQMEMETDPEYVNRRLRYIFTYPTQYDAEGKVLLERRQVIERLESADGSSTTSWSISDQQRRSAGGAVIGALPPQALGPEENWEDLPGSPTAWAHSWPPIHEGKNLPEPNSAWGKPDLRPDLIHINEVLNREESNLSKIIYYHAHPQDIFIGVAGWHEIERSPGSALFLANPNAKVMHIELQSDLGAIQKRLEDLREHMDEQSHVPSVAVGRLRNLPAIPSGVALKTAYRPLTSQTALKRQLREPVLIKLCQHILELGGYGANRKITVHWPQMLPTDDLNEAQTAQIWLAIGASEQTLLERGGFDYAVEQQHKQEEAEAALARMQQQQAAMQAQNGQNGQNPPETGANAAQTGENGPQTGPKGSQNGKTPPANAQEQAISSSSGGGGPTR
jgi:Phage portal protein, SPP1 Gp6-like